MSMGILNHCSTIGVCLAILPQIHANEIHWGWVAPSPHGNNVVGMTATLDGTLIQVCERGQVYRSTDSNQWLPAKTTVTASLRAVVRFGESVVVTGEAGTILVSTDDGSTFTAIHLTTDNWLESVAASSDTIVAVGDQGSIYASSDGTTWQAQDSTTLEWLRGVAFGNQTFVAVGENGTVLSTDSQGQWQVNSSGTSTHLNGVTFWNNAFWAAAESGRVLTSADGVSWTIEETGAQAPLLFVGGFGDVLIAGGEGSLFAREGGAWIDQSTLPSEAPPSATYLCGLAHENVFRVGGRTGMLVSGLTDGTSLAWTENHDNLRPWLWDVSQAGDLWLACGDRGTILTSELGIDWELAAVPDGLIDRVLLGIDGDDAIQVAVGSQGTVLVSDNGIQWRQVDPAPTTHDLQGVAVGHGRIVVSGGGGLILTNATDIDTAAASQSWSAATTGVTEFISSVCSWPGGFVAAGNHGTLLTSPDGTIWTPQSTGVQDWIYSVRYLGDLLIAVGQNGLILSSPDGERWTVTPSGTQTWLNDIGHLDGRYVAVGTQGTVLTSSDRTSWSPAFLPTGKSLYGIAGHDHQFVTVGIEGIALRGDTQKWRIAGFSPLESTRVFLISGDPRDSFELQHSENLRDWTGVLSSGFQDPSGLMILETPSSSSASGFYRLSVPLGRAE